MQKESKVNSNLSVILILGYAVNKLPLILVQKFLQKAINTMQQQHPSVFEKLANDNLDFIIDATDLPFAFYLNPSKVELKAFYRGEITNTSATIKGKLIDLLMLFEGEKDGDAMFFSKELVIEGSTAAIVNLRNTIDGEDMNIIDDLSNIVAPYNEIFKKTSHLVIKAHNKLQNFLDSFTSATTFNTQKNLDATNLKIDTIIEDIESFKQFLYEYKKQEIRKKSDYKNAENT
jgi:predicted lipid carrier protein YhbT